MCKHLNFNCDAETMTRNVGTKPNGIGTSI